MKMLSFVSDTALNFMPFGNIIGSRSYINK